MAALPQLSGDVFITDGGMETTLIFHQGMDLPSFAAFDLLRTEEGTEALREYYAPYLRIARERGVGAALDTATWRASPDWGAALGYSTEELADANRQAVALLQELREGQDRILISGCIGPRGDGYQPGELMAVAEAEAYHSPQAGWLAEAGADFLSALTITTASEATGIVRAAGAAGMDVVVSFTVETDGRLPNGQGLGDAIEEVDEETGGAPAYFMVNCAHPTHFADVLDEGGWRDRIRGLRANASRKSHAELDESDELDPGDPVELASDYAALRPRLRKLNVVGGCCGTDHRHIAELADTWLGAGAGAA